MTDRDVHLSHEDRQAVQRSSRLSSRLIYEVIREDGVEELRRPTSSLLYAGIAAGVVITFSFLCKALFAANLPEAEWAPMITNFGYTVGFLLVILSRMQLFTENTISTVVPLFNNLCPENLAAVGRLWGIVFGANMIGTAIAALFLTYAGVTSPEVDRHLMEIAEHFASFPALELFLRGIPAGILIAAIVWMMPSANASGFWVILFFTYLIALGDFAHVIVGSAEMTYLVLHGGASILDWIAVIALAALGNIVGGTAVFTLMIYGQVTEEIDEEKSDQELSAEEEEAPAE
ncbi:formate/nitrite transporter family protein [Paracoccaceae bacterium GXU_MW_L88]